MSPQVQARSQQLPGSTSVCYRKVISLLLAIFLISSFSWLASWNQDIKSEINPVLNPRAAGPEGSLMAIPGIQSCSSYFNITSLCFENWFASMLCDLFSIYSVLCNYSSPCWERVFWDLPGKCCDVLWLCLHIDLVNRRFFWPGSNQGSNNLTLKGWPLTVSNPFILTIIWIQLYVTTGS